MKKKFFLNANIIDPYNAIDEIGGLILGENTGIKKIIGNSNFIKVLDKKLNCIIILNYIFF